MNSILLLNINSNISDQIFEKEKLNLINVNSAEEILTLNSETINSIKLIIFGLESKEKSNIQTIKYLKENFETFPILGIADIKQIKPATKLLKFGLNDYIVDGMLNFDYKLNNIIQDVLKGYLIENIDIDDSKNLSNLIYSDIKIRKIIKLLKKSANSNIPILLNGERGTGKDLFARVIHNVSKKKNKPFVIVNCATISSDSVEQILFGSETEKGKFQEAEGGTIFFDEITELSLDMQVALLKAIQEKEIRLYNGEIKKINVRIISAAYKDLKTEVNNNKFREDLYYRLNVFSITIPPLRERKNDIPLLIKVFYKHFSKLEGKTIHGISNKALKLLENHQWPGNVRELRNMIYKAVALTSNKILDENDFELLNIQHERTKTESVKSSVSCVSIVDINGKVRDFKEIEVEVIEKALTICKGNLSEVSKLLDIGRATLYRKLRDEEEV